MNKTEFYKKKLSETDMPPLDDRSPLVSYFEFWPAWLFYLPMKAYTVYLLMRYRGLTTAMAANPKIFAGGFIGESKSEILNFTPKNIEHHFAEYFLLENPANFKTELALNGFEYPFVAKPDVAERGAGVQVVFSDHDLQKYITSFPDGEKIFLQKLYDYPAEAGLFYIRKPNEEKGKIFSLTLKYFPYVVGDGKRSLKDLISDDPRAGMLAHLYTDRHKKHLDDIIDDGQKFRLAFAGTHSKGSIFKDGGAYITPKLEHVWDELAKQIPELYFCRFDVRFQNMRDLDTLENLKIIEINGAGAEATHIWDSKTSLWTAYKTLMKQYKTMFEIGLQNRKRGHKVMSSWQFRKLVVKNKKLKQQFPETF